MAVFLSLSPKTFFFEAKVIEGGALSLSPNSLPSILPNHLRARKERARPLLYATGSRSFRSSIWGPFQIRNE